MASPADLPAGPHSLDSNMIRLITAGACALFLASCTADSPNEGGNQPAANKVIENATTAKFTIGKNI